MYIKRFPLNEDNITPDELQDKNIYLKTSLASRTSSELKQFMKDIQKLEWSDLIFEKNRGGFLIKLPERLKTTANNLIGKSEWQYGLDEGTGYFNRTHFSGGISQKIKGVGFGYKMYKCAVKNLGIASSRPNASAEAQYVWARLMQDPDFYCIVSNDFIVVIDKAKPKDWIKEQVKSIVNEFELSKKDPKNVQMSNTLVSFLPELRLNKYRSIEIKARHKRMLTSKVERDRIKQQELARVRRDEMLSSLRDAKVPTDKLKIHIGSIYLNPSDNIIYHVYKIETYGDNDLLFKYRKLDSDRYSDSGFIPTNNRMFDLKNFKIYMTGFPYLVNGDHYHFRFNNQADNSLAGYVDKIKNIEINQGILKQLVDNNDYAEIPNKIFINGASVESSSIKAIELLAASTTPLDFNIDEKVISFIYDAWNAENPLDYTGYPARVVRIGRKRNKVRLFIPKENNELGVPLRNVRKFRYIN